MAGIIFIILVCAGAFSLEYLLNQLVDRLNAELEDAKKKVGRAVEICIKEEYWEEAVDLVGSIPKWKFRFIGGHRLSAHAVVQPFTITLPQAAAFFEKEGKIDEAEKTLEFAKKCQTICERIPYNTHCCGGAARVIH